MVYIPFVYSGASAIENRPDDEATHCETIVQGLTKTRDLMREYASTRGSEGRQTVAELAKRAADATESGNLDFAKDFSDPALDPVFGQLSELYKYQSEQTSHGQTTNDQRRIMQETATRETRYFANQMARDAVAGDDTGDYGKQTQKTWGQTLSAFNPFGDKASTASAATTRNQPTPSDLLTRWPQDNLHRPPTVFRRTPRVDHTPTDTTNGNSQYYVLSANDLQSLVKSFIDATRKTVQEQMASSVGRSTPTSWGATPTSASVRLPFGQQGNFTPSSCHNSSWAARAPVIHHHYYTGHPGTSRFPELASLLSAH